MTTLTQARSSLFGSNKSNAPGTIDRNLRSSISEPNTTTTSKRQEEREREDPCNAIMSHKRKAIDGEIDLSLSLKIAPREEIKIDKRRRIGGDQDEEDEEVLESSTDLSLSLCSYY